MVAYFGAFDESRWLDGLLSVISQLENKNGIHVHVFTGNKDVLEQKLVDTKMTDVVFVNDSLDYLTFLNSLQTFDYLYVNDAKATQYFEVNPYLSSKYSDYKVAGVDIMAICEKYSELDKLDIKGEGFYSKENIYEAINKTGFQKCLELNLT